MSSTSKEGIHATVNRSRMHIRQTVDDRQQVIAGCSCCFNELLLVTAHFTQPQHVQHALSQRAESARTGSNTTNQDAVERRSHLVAHSRQELTLRCSGRACVISGNLSLRSKQHSKVWKPSQRARPTSFLACAYCLVRISTSSSKPYSKQRNSQRAEPSTSVVRITMQINSCLRKNRAQKHTHI